MRILRKKIKVAKVCFTARANANVDDCIRECIAFSAKNNVETTLEHNGVTIEIGISAMVTRLFNKWETKMNKK